MDFRCGFIAAIVLLAGCVTGPGMKDCGTDITCFQEAAQTCTPAKVRVIEQGTTMYMELRGLNAEKCTSYFKIEKIALPAGTPPEAAGFVTMFEGKDMTCELPMSMVAEIGGNVMAEATSGEEFLDMCKGSLIDTIKTLMAGLGGLQ